MPDGGAFGQVEGELGVGKRIVDVAVDAFTEHCINKSG